jgi:hypothetical protein
MNNLLYVIAVILIVVWAVGYLGLHAHGIIHVLPVFVLVIIIIRVLQGKRK